MQKLTKETAFKPEAKGDATTRAARAIIDGEIAQRDAKTARLRAARLAKEAEDLASAPPVLPKVTKAKAAAAAKAAKPIDAKPAAAKTPTKRAKKTVEA
jgi:hypothetical protein